MRPSMNRESARNDADRECVGGSRGNIERRRLAGTRRMTPGLPRVAILPVRVDARTLTRTSAFQRGYHRLGQLATASINGVTAEDAGGAPCLSGHGDGKGARGPAQAGWSTRDRRLSLESGLTCTSEGHYTDRDDTHRIEHCQPLEIHNRASFPAVTFPVTAGGGSLTSQRGGADRRTGGGMLAALRMLGIASGDEEGREIGQQAPEEHHA